jgi:type VI secretion system FHA domain protein
MPLTLTLAGAHGPAGNESRTLAEGNLAIGRSADNGWVLPDPDRLLSKTHCFITMMNGRYVLTDVSTNGTFVNGSGTRVPRNGQVVLTDGDEFRIGDYVISVAEGPAMAAAPAPRRGPADSAVDFGGRVDPLDDALGSDPLDSPFTAAPGFAHPLAAPAQPAWRTDDPFDGADEAGKGGPSTGFDDDLLKPVAPADPWGLAAQPDNADAPAHAFTAPRAIAPSTLADFDFDDLLGDTPPGQPAPPPAAFAAPPPAPPPAVAQAPPPPAPAVQVVQIVHAAPVAAPVAAPAPPAADAAKLLAAFLEGAGAPGLAAGNDPEAALRAAGEVFRAMVEGVRQVLISRAAIKNELRVEQTMLRARDNNALKFSVTADDAVAALLAPGRPGYQAPVAAAREAFADISSHEMAVMAGVQTALMALLKRFDPAALEQRLAKGGLLGNILPSARKARTWELFCATYGEIAREAEDDFQSVFGREFARAYDAQMRKL